MTTPRLRPLADTSPALWLAKELSADERTIGAFVPLSYPSFVQVSFARPDLRRPMGDIDPSIAAELAGVLRSFTGTPESCFFASWEGYAGPFTGEPTITFPPERGMHVFAGSIDDAARKLDDQLPLRWWPQDHAWCVGGYMYGSSLYVGGSADATAAILGNHLLDARPVDVNHERLDEYE